jgi:chromosomal replication initiator protein
MYLAREHTGETLPAIGARFGGRNHTTVMHACGRAKQRIAADRDAFATVSDIARSLNDEDAVGSG